MKLSKIEQEANRMAQIHQENFEIECRNNYELLTAIYHIADNTECKETREFCEMVIKHHNGDQH